MSFLKTNAHWLSLTATAAASVAGTAFLMSDFKDFPEVLEKLQPKQITPKKPTPVDLSSLKRSAGLVAKPGEWSANHLASLFVSEPYLQEPDGLKRPKDGSVHRHSKTGQPIPNSWFLQYKLPLGSSKIPTQDTDEDGFSNEEEWVAGSDPTDPKQHPPVVTKLFFTKQQETHDRISFLQYLGDTSKPNSLRITVRRDDAAKKPQHELKLGDTIPETEIKVTAFTPRRKDSEALKEALDGSLVTLLNGKTGAQAEAEVKGMAADFVDKTITLRLNYAKDSRDIVTKPGQSINLTESESYTVVDSSPSGATVKDTSGKTFEIRALPPD